MAERGIIFSAPMVRALLDGRKTQTRRLAQVVRPPVRPRGNDITVRWSVGEGIHNGATFRLPHAIGDRLYVREHWKVDSYYDPFAPMELTDLDSFDGTICYLSSAPAESLRDPVWGKHRQAMHMPRWASRLTLTVTDVRVQRLQEISEADARAEGIEQHGRFFGLAHWDWDDVELNARSAFRRLWNSLHDKPGTRWEDNPWLYALTFTVQHGNIDRVPHG